MQECCEKYQSYCCGREQIHFIGHLQTNKIRVIIDKVSMVESVDTLHLAAALQKECARRGMEMDILLQVNIGAEPTKSGFPAGGDLGGLPGNQRLLQPATGAGADGHSAESAGRPVFWADGGIISAAADGRLPRADARTSFLWACRGILNGRSGLDRPRSGWDGRCSVNGLRRDKDKRGVNAAKTERRNEYGTGWKTERNVYGIRRRVR